MTSTTTKLVLLSLCLAAASRPPKSAFLGGGSSLALFSPVRAVVVNTKMASDDDDGAIDGAVDAHLHLWSASPEMQVAPPAGLEDASAERFWQEARAAGVSAAVVTQPVNYGHDHSYLEACLRRNKATMRGIWLADPAQALPADLRARGFAGVRLNPALWGERIDDAAGDALFEACADAGFVVCVMAFATGFSESLEAQLERLMRKYPSVLVALDHFGFPRENPAAPPAPHLAFDERKWQRLLDFGTKFPETSFVKLSAFFRVSQRVVTDDFAADLQPRVRQLLDAYGPTRLFWGSDFPFALLPSYGGAYAPTLASLRDWLSSDDAPLLGLSDDARHAILAGNARRLFFEE